MNIGKRPTELLGLSSSVFEDLMLDAAILAKVLPKEAGASSLADEIREKRRRLALKRYAS